MSEYITDLLVRIARRGEPAFIDRLKEIVQGGKSKPVYGRAHWYSLSRTVVRDSGEKFNLETQLFAVRLLGETNNPVALEFLTELYEESSRWEETDQMLNFVPDQGPHEPAQGEPVRNRIIFYKNARGELADALTYTLSPSVDFKSNPQIADYDNMTPSYSAVSKNAHEVVGTAIRRLRDSLEK